jgi:hypothetical protein
LAGLGFHPIFSQPRLLLAFNNARMQQKMEALDLSIGIKSQKKFDNLGRSDVKACKAKEKDIHFLLIIHLLKKLVNKDLNFDFMDLDRRESY